MKTNASRATLFEVWAAHPVVALLTALLGALTAAAVSYYAFRILAAGDEAPIRVRNGSIEIEVVHRDRTWRDQSGGAQNRWRLSRGTRSSDEYQLYLAPTDPSHCSNVTSTRGRVIRFILNDNEQMWIEVRSTGRKSEVTSGIPLQLSGDERVLSFGGTGNFITDISVDGSVRCTFPSNDAALHTLLTE